VIRANGRSSIVLAIVLVALVGCGKKGLDRHLDLSGNAQDLGASFGTAMAEVPPEQQNVMRERVPEIGLRIVGLAAASNPAIVEANLAKANADQLENIKKMSVGEVFQWHLSDREAKVKSAIDQITPFASPPGPISFTVSQVQTPECVTMSQTGCRQLRVKGGIVIKNTSGNDVRVTQLSVVPMLGDQQLDSGFVQHKCGMRLEKGGIAACELNLLLTKPDPAVLGQVTEALQSGDPSAIGWKFSSQLAVDVGGELHDVGEASLTQLKQNLTKLTADKAVMSKR